MTSTLLALPGSDAATGPVDLDDLPFAISMLDGGLGAVPGLGGQAVAPRADIFCWCGCMVCFAPPTSLHTDSDENGAV
ncbi:MAG TPA: hypothetical protein VHX38_27575 [Pseudonocardiaceae bacterium]|jgi:hypothetical protein|nr:hypothetical protein [Pseudonocardiaceae bacterium]